MVLCSVCLEHSSVYFGSVKKTTHGEAAAVISILLDASFGAFCCVLFERVSSCPRTQFCRPNWPQTQRVKMCTFFLALSGTFCFGGVLFCFLFFS